MLSRAYLKELSRDYVLYTFLLSLAATGLWWLRNCVIGLPMPWLENAAPVASTWTNIAAVFLGALTIIGFWFALTYRIRATLDISYPGEEGSSESTVWSVVIGFVAALVNLNGPLAFLVWFVAINVFVFAICNQELLAAIWEDRHLLFEALSKRFTLPWHRQAQRH